MTSRSDRYDLLAVLLDYPQDDDFREQLTRCADVLEGGYSAARRTLQPLRDLVAEMSLEQAQEMYTRTFDINPVCTLEVGWHIYGEDYGRGEFLVKMRQQLREMNLPESQELPDHLTHVLSIFGRLSGEEAEQLAARYVLPALDKMLAGMSETEHPYRAVLEAIVSVVRLDHDVEIVNPRERRGDPPDWENRLPVFGAQGCVREERKP